MLNWNSAKFQAKAVGALILAVQVKVLSKELHSWFFLKIYLTKNLKIADVGYRVGSNILWMKLEKMQDILEELWAGWWEAPVHVICENDNFAVFGLRPFFVRVRSTIRHNAFLWQKSNGDKLFQGIFSNCGRHPVADSWRFWWHDEERASWKESNLPVQFIGGVTGSWL